MKRPHITSIIVVWNCMVLIFSPCCLISLALFPPPSSLFFPCSFPASWRLWSCLLSSARRNCGGRGLPQIVHRPAHMGECVYDDVMGNTMHGKWMWTVTSCQLCRYWENPRSFWLLFLRNLDNLHSQLAQMWVRGGISPSCLKIFLFSTFFSPRLSPPPSFT